MARKKSPDLNAQLIAAVDKSNKAGVIELLAAGADPNARSKADEPAITLACFEDAIEILTLLLDAGADVNAVDSFSNPAVIVALEHENLPMMELLIARGTDLNCQSDDDQQNTVLTRALCVDEIEAPSLPVLDLLLRSGADPNQPSGEGCMPLHYAADYADPALTARLLEAGARVDAVDFSGQTPLMVAARRGHVAVMERLIQAGADVNFQSDDGDDSKTVLLSVLDPNEVTTHAEAAIRTLLRAGAHPDTPSPDGWRPLLYAASLADPTYVGLLLEAGADVKATRGTDIYAIDVADDQGHKDVVARLLAHGSPTLAQTSAARMQALWARIGRWYEKNAPSYASDLANATGASQEEIENLERKLKVELPWDFKAHLLMYGRSDRVGFYQYSGLSVAQIERWWSGLESLRKDGTWKDIEPRELSADDHEIKWTWWHAKWVPFAVDGGGNLYCLDLAPDRRGHRGQVIKWEKASGPIGPFAAGFNVFLEKYFARMEAGDLEYKDESLYRK